MLNRDSFVDPPNEFREIPFWSWNEELTSIELVNTLSNLLGPLHSAGGEGDYTGLGEYWDARQQTVDHVLTPFGFDRVVLEFFE